jgi:hypothetical protein
MRARARKKLYRLGKVIPENQYAKIGKSKLGHWAMQHKMIEAFILISL